MILEEDKIFKDIDSSINLSMIEFDTRLLGKCEEWKICFLIEANFHVLIKICKHKEC